MTASRSTILTVRLRRGRTTRGVEHTRPSWMSSLLEATPTSRPVPPDSLCTMGQARKPLFSPGTILSGSTSVQAVFVDPSADIIVGTDQGLSILPAGTSTFTGNELPAAASVSQICLDDEGVIYAATSKGLYILGSSIVLASSTPARCVCVDGAGSIYVGTDSGLLVSSDQGSTWTTLLSDQVVTSVTTTAPIYSF